MYEIDDSQSCRDDSGEEWKGGGGWGGREWVKGGFFLRGVCGVVACAAEVVSGRLLSKTL